MNNKKIKLLMAFILLITLVIIFYSTKKIRYEGENNDDIVLSDSTPKLITPYYYRNSYVVADFSISPSGGDMTNTIQDALNKCANQGGGTVWLERGIYKVNKPIYVPSMCTLMGDYQDPDNYQGTLDYGTKIVVDVNTFQADTSDLEKTGLFKIGASAGIDGLTIYYKNQNVNNPKAQPWSIHYTEYMLFNIKNITLINSYLGIGRSTSMNAHEMLMIENVKGTILKKGVVIHNSADVGTITGLSFAPKYWAKANLKAFDDNSSNPSESTISSTVKARDGFGLEITDAEQSEYVNISLSGFKYGIYIPNANEIKSRLFGSGSIYNLNISDCSIGIKVENGVYTGCGYGKGCSMIDYRWGYLISNASIAGSEYAIYTDSPKVGNQVGTLKLNSVSIKGKVGGIGSVIFNSSGNSYTSVPKETDLTNQINNTNKFSNLNVYRNKKPGGSNFANLSSGSSVDQINQTLSNISSKGGGVVYLGPGRYNINKTVNVPANVELRGSSATSTRVFNVGTTFVVSGNFDINNRVVDIVGNNSGLSGINIIYENNVTSLNSSSAYTRYNYAIMVESSNGVFVNNVAISGAAHGIFVHNSQNFTIENIITGIMEDAFVLDSSSNGLIMNCLQNGTVIARNGLVAFNEGASLFKNVFTPNTYSKFTQIVVKESSNIELLNIFAFGIQKSLSITNSKGVYAVNIGKDATNGTIFESINSEAVLVNALKFGGVRISGGNSGTYNTANPGGIGEADNLNNIFNVAKKYINSKIKLSSTSITLNDANKDVSYEFDGDGTVSCTSSSEVFVKCSVNSTKRTITLTPVNNASSPAVVTVYGMRGKNYDSTSATISVIVNKSSIFGGDVNGNGKIDSTDYVAIRKHLLQNPKLTGDRLKRADANSDGKVNTTDYVVVRKAIINGNITPSVPVNLDSTPPTINSWESTSLKDTTVSGSKGTTTICNLGSDSGDGLKTIEYYSNCMDKKTASISSGCATITIDACANSTLYYQLKDNYNYSSQNTVNDIGEYLIYAQVYNKLLYPGTAALNNSSNISYHVNRCSQASSCVRDLGNAAIDQRTSDSNQVFVENLYKGILGRGADSGGLNSWVSTINSGTSKYDVLNGFISSGEAQTIYNAWGYN